jgi:peptidoglycan/xylan/chitin deacetylase (PgdA/CDA1 family)
VESGVRVVPLSELGRARAERDPARPQVAITFDDGLRSVYEHGLPVLAGLGLTATVFLVTDYCGKTNSWPGQPPGLGDRPLLGWPEIKEMAGAGIAFASHGRTHRDLTRLDDREIAAEMADSRRAIEEALGHAAVEFAYPYGAHDARVREIARAHFDLACATTLDFVAAGSDRFALERLDMYYFRRSSALGRLFAPEVRAYVALRRGLRACRRALGS